jgi:hypothetical protein
MILAVLGFGVCIVLVVWALRDISLHERYERCLLAVHEQLKTDTAEREDANPPEQI